MRSPGAALAGRHASQIERGHATVEPRSTLPVVRGWVGEIMGLLYVIYDRRLLSMLDSFRKNAPLRR